MTISVLIATYNRSPLLDECLTHLRDQAFRPGDEVVVVDNGSTDDTRAIVAGHQRAFPVPLRLLSEKQPGKSHALRLGIAVAGGEILALTDDDVRVGDGWLDAIRAAMSDPRVALIGGRVKPRWEKSPPFWLRVDDGYGPLTAPLALLDYGTEPIALGVRTAIGANLAVRRDVVHRVGGFSPNLGKLRGTLLSGEDHDLCRRVQASGLRAMYCPAAVVHHLVPAHRLRITYCLNWFFWAGITHAILDQAPPPSIPERLGLSMRVARQFVGGLGRSALALLQGRWARAVEQAAGVAFAAGYGFQQCGLALRSHQEARPGERTPQPARESV